MKLKEGELKVYYRIEGGIWPGLDDCLINALKEFGYEMWASGTNLITDVRDLAFDKEGE